MKSDELLNIISDFTEGLLKKAKVKHAGNCLVMSQILKAYLSAFYDIHTTIENTWVKESEKKIVNHYYLKMRNGQIIDATASQFTNMPKVYIGNKPKNYLPINEY